MSIADDIRTAATSLAQPEAPTVESQDAAPAEPVVGEVDATPAPEAAETAAETMARVRDDKGRFAAKAAEAKTAAPVAPKLVKTATVAPAPGQPTETAAPIEATATATPKPTLKAPQSWKPAAREKWASLDPDVQAEVDRVDREVRAVMQESAPAKKFLGEFQQAISPYQAMLAAEGADPIRAVASLMQTAAALRTAPPAHKAALVAQIIKGYSIDIDTLAAALDGQAPAAQPQQPAAPAEYRDPRVDQMIQRATQQRQAQAAQALSEFSSKAEFLEDVRQDMADLLDFASKRGVAMTLEDAYNRACQLHPEISGVLKQRDEVAAAKAKLASTQRARDAGSLSVRSQPAAAPPPSKKGGSIMEDLMEAKERLTQ